MVTLAERSAACGLMKTLSWCKPIGLQLGPLKKSFRLIKVKSIPFLISYSGMELDNKMKAIIGIWNDKMHLYLECKHDKNTSCVCSKSN